MLYITDSCSLFLARDTDLTVKIERLDLRNAINLIDSTNQEEINTYITDETTKIYLMQVLSFMSASKKVIRRPKSGDKILFIYIPEQYDDLVADTKLRLITIV